MFSSLLPSVVVSATNRCDPSPAQAPPPPRLLPPRLLQSAWQLLFYTTISVWTPWRDISISTHRLSKFRMESNHQKDFALFQYAISLNSKYPSLLIELCLLGHTKKRNATSSAITRTRDESASSFTWNLLDLTILNRFFKKPVFQRNYLQRGKKNK